MNIAVIGSGLAAISAIEALVARGIRPVVLDMGLGLDGKVNSVADRLSMQSPDLWNLEDRRFIASNPTIANRAAIPRKLFFGSDFFYGRSHPEAQIYGNGDLPPLSYAKGGLSVGWGSAVLPPDRCDLEGWPILASTLAPYFAQVIRGKPYSAVDDALSLNFPFLSKDVVPIELTEGNRNLLRDMECADILAKDRLVFGQSRLMTCAEKLSSKPACRYCGQCMSGCVYGAIYKASGTLDSLRAERRIEYRAGLMVKSLHDGPKGVVVRGASESGECFEFSFDRVFLGAGAVNSTRIILQSKKMFGQSTVLHSTVGFIAPMLRFKRAPLAWPNSNTLPGIFLEYKVKSLSNHWVHCQVSTPNELVLQRLNLDAGETGITAKFKTILAEHLILAVGNLHSVHGNGYKLWLEKGSGEYDSVLRYSRENNELSRHAVKAALRELKIISARFGCIPLLPMVKDSTRNVGFHVGGSLPMKAVPIAETDTDSFGTPKGWHRIHVVDSSVFPSLPGTTIGLLAMANAYRIATEVPLE